ASPHQALSRSRRVEIERIDVDARASSSLHCTTQMRRRAGDPLDLVESFRPELDPKALSRRAYGRLEARRTNDGSSSSTFQFDGRAQARPPIVRCRDRVKCIFDLQRCQVTPMTPLTLGYI